MSVLNGLIIATITQTARIQLGPFTVTAQTDTMETELLAKVVIFCIHYCWGDHINLSVLVNGEDKENGLSTRSIVGITIGTVSVSTIVLELRRFSGDHT